VKPTKAPDANKINIESHIQTSRDPEMIEQVNVGETAIIHCTFHNVEQVGAYKQAKVCDTISLISWDIRTPDLAE